MAVSRRESISIGSVAAVSAHRAVVLHKMLLLERLLLLSAAVPLATCALFFPTNSAYGILGALAVPLDLPHRNVFISYNFEANYNLPTTWGIPPAFLGVEDEDLVGQYEERSLDAGECQKTGNCTLSADTPGNVNGTEGEPLNRARRSLLSRTHFYQILKDKFERSGFVGEACLLRLICETNASELGQVNGVLGSIIHILFSPSTSWYEQLPLHYYQAETDGHQEQCAHYEASCGESLLDLISQPLHEILNNI